MVYGCHVIEHPAPLFTDQKPGTSGLRKPVRTVQQSHYVENFVQAVLDTARELEPSNTSLLVGGDGRFYNDKVIPLIVRMAACAGYTRITVGTGGIFSTPACSAYIRQHECAGGILLTASHNPGGPEGDFGIKYNVSNGGPAPDAVTTAIFERTKSSTSYTILEEVEISLDEVRSVELDTELGKVVVNVVNGVECHEKLLSSIFDLQAIRKHMVENKLLITADSMSGVMGPTVKRIFGEVLQVPSEHLLRCEPLPDFGGGHPDPNLAHAQQLLAAMQTGRYEFGVAFDGDGDRNMILGKDGFFVSPSDSLAVIAANLDCISNFANADFCGVGRSLPTSGAVDKVCESLGLPVYETPTGWKYFGSLMDAGKIGLCGEESFGTGSSHIREKDGIWAAFAWLSILTQRSKGVEEVLREHWSKYGRHYYSRHDWEGLETNAGADLMDLLKGCVSRDVSTLPLMGQEKVRSAVNFSYTDPVTGEVAANQGIVFTAEGGSRVVFRLSGTGSTGATVRIYLEHYAETDLDRDTQEILQPLSEFALLVSDIKKISGMQQPTVIT